VLPNGFFILKGLFKMQYKKVIKVYSVSELRYKLPELVQLGIFSQKQLEEGIKVRLSIKVGKKRKLKTYFASLEKKVCECCGPNLYVYKNGFRVF